VRPYRWRGPKPAQKPARGKKAATSRARGKNTTAKIKLVSYNILKDNDFRDGAVHSNTARGGHVDKQPGAASGPVGPATVATIATLHAGLESFKQGIAALAGSATIKPAGRRKCSCRNGAIWPPNLAGSRTIFSAGADWLFGWRRKSSKRSGQSTPSPNATACLIA
jgi:hypothetical protein